jgi:acyl-coenzyme A synthetase/AMP-(fatty) acid ligase
VAITRGSRSVTYGQLGALAERIAKRLMLLGYTPGDVVGLRLNSSVNSPLHLALFWASARTGFVLFDIPIGLTTIELKQIVAEVHVDVVVVDDPDDSIPELKSLLVHELSALNPELTTSLSWPELDSTAKLLINQSSGTTGSSKLFAVSHGQFIEAADMYRFTTGWSDQDRVMGLSMADPWGRDLCLTSLLVGSTIVHSDVSEPHEEYAMLQESGVTLIFSEPKHLESLLDAGADQAASLTDLRVVVTSSSALLPAVHERFCQQLSPNIYNWYGTNEFPFISMLTQDELDSFPGSVGRPLPGIEVQIVDANYKPVAAGATGLLGTRSSNMLREYVDNEAATRRSFRDGWFYPGDNAFMNEAGYIFLQGRARGPFESVPPQIRSDLRLERHDNEVVIWSPVALQPLHLDPVDTVVFDLLVDGVSVGDLNGDLCAVFEVNKAVARDLLQRTLSRLEVGGVLTPSVSTQGHPSAGS